MIDIERRIASLRAPGGRGEVGGPNRDDDILALLDENTSLLLRATGAEAEVVALKEARKISRCVYCGDESANDPETILAHIRTCEKRNEGMEAQLRQYEHFGAELLAERDELRKLLDRGIKLHDQASAQLKTQRDEIARLVGHIKSAISALQTTDPAMARRMLYAIGEASVAEPDPT